jgi:hypothetical protein
MSAPHPIFCPKLGTAINHEPGRDLFRSTAINWLGSVRELDFGFVAKRLAIQNRRAAARYYAPPCLGHSLSLWTRCRTAQTDFQMLMTAADALDLFA